jgi:glycosyltransferase involved in cell wall biosynthesis
MKPHKPHILASPWSFNSMKTISVVMSIFNTEERVLRESLISILNQTYSNFELLVILDGDYSHESFIKSFNDSRIRLIRNDKNMGLAYSMNLAIANSVGDFIFRADADDIYAINRFEKQIAELNKGYDIVSSRCLEISYYGEPLKFTRKYPFHTYIMRFLLYRFNLNTVIHSSVAARREVFINYKYNNDFFREQDFELWKRIRKSYKIHFMSDVLVLYRKKMNE